jgi:magnesium transporter
MPPGHLRNPLLVPDLRELIGAGEQEAVREFLEDHHPAQVAELIEDLEPAEGDTLLRLLEPRVRSEVMSYLEPETQVRVAETMKPSDAATLLQHMSHDERADLVNRLDDNIVDEILRRLAHAEREDIRRLASYEPGTAGAVMTTDYATLPPTVTVREAIDRLRQEAPDRETIYYSYVVDDARKLIGLVSLKNLLLARPRARIEDVMKTDLVVARVDEDQESVAHKIEDYDLIAIPVVDTDDRLLGIVTHDDAADILRQEGAEDTLRFAGVAAEAEAEQGAIGPPSLVAAVRRRVGWLLLLFFGGSISSFVVDHFKWVDGSVASAINLAAFIPLLIGTGGNAGSQTVGTIIRGISLGEINAGDGPRVVLREALTGLLLGLLLGTIGFAFTWLVLRNPPTFSLVIALSVVGICVWANTMGAVVPLVAHRVGIDPAVVSAPMISTLVDATGLVIYYSIAIAVLLKLGTP